MTTFKCPVCGRTGIPDYLSEKVVCPNCNSDLSIYHSLHLLDEESNNADGNTNRYKSLVRVLSIILLAVLLIAGISVSYYYKDAKSSKEKLIAANNVTSELNDSIRTLSNLIVAQKGEPLTSNQFIEYSIIANDSPWRIIRKFYGNRSDWENISRKIAELNGIWDERTSEWKPIYPGQTIKLYNFK